MITIQGVRKLLLVRSTDSYASAISVSSMVVCSPGNQIQTTRDTEAEANWGLLTDLTLPVLWNFLQARLNNLYLPTPLSPAIPILKTLVYGFRLDPKDAESWAFGKLFYALSFLFWITLFTVVAKTSQSPIPYFAETSAQIIPLPQVRYLRPCGSICLSQDLLPSITNVTYQSTKGSTTQNQQLKSSRDYWLSKANTKATASARQISGIMRSRKWGSPDVSTSLMWVSVPSMFLIILVSSTPSVGRDYRSVAASLEQIVDLPESIFPSRRMLIQLSSNIDVVYVSQRTDCILSPIAVLTLKHAICQRVFMTLGNQSRGTMTTSTLTWLLMLPLLHGLFQTLQSYLRAWRVAHSYRVVPLPTVYTLTTAKPVQVQVVIQIVFHYSKLVDHVLVGMAVYPVPSLEVDNPRVLSEPAGNEFASVVVNLSPELDSGYPDCSFLDWACVIPWYSILLISCFSLQSFRNRLWRTQQPFSSQAEWHYLEQEASVYHLQYRPASHTDGRSVAPRLPTEALEPWQGQPGDMAKVKLLDLLCVFWGFVLGKGRIDKFGDWVEREVRCSLQKLGRWQFSEQTQHCLVPQVWHFQSATTWGKVLGSWPHSNSEMLLSQKLFAGFLASNAESTEAFILLKNFDSLLNIRVLTRLQLTYM